MKQLLRLRGISGEVKGRVWESDALLRAGRLNSLEIVLEDGSVSRRHAEVRFAEPSGWWVRDLESTNGTYINGVRLGTQEKQLHARDIVQFGKVAMMVELPDAPRVVAEPTDDHPPIESSTSSSWEEGVARLAFDRNNHPRAGDQLMALLRAGRHMVSIENETDLMHSILNDAVAVLDAQRAAIVLPEGQSGELKLKASASKSGETSSRIVFSRNLALRCFGEGRSLLCGSVVRESEYGEAPSIVNGSMASVMCVLLRTPRKRLGVLHLDRGFFQRPFTEDDLHLADALASHVSAAIENAQLLKYQRDLFLNTITTLAQAVELRDEYTGGHTARVTAYSVLLGEHLGLSANEMDIIRRGTPLHDIGKIGIEDAILRKPGKLDDHEFEIIKTHTIKGETILKTIPELYDVIPIVRSHHERWDGNGYPDRLVGDQIPLLARIVAVADSFDAMTSNRPYHLNKRGKTADEGFEEIRRVAGKQFDPDIARAFLEIHKQILDSMSANKQTSFLPVRGPNV